ncbi:MAG TPA: class I SAM-dependent methyltransferase [Streptosporangiaceae bacterium]|nr:class I SAM-dependent methyltransferase [Streptosporangiaceae bacterium]
MTDVSVSEEIRQFWDEDAAVYDSSPGHHPRRPHEQAAWSAALRRLLPDPPARVLDAGAGTGFLSLLLARHGYQVTAMDLSSRMLEVLRGKAGRLGVAVQTVQADAASPPAGPFDAVVERHLIWTLPDPGAALAAWRRAAPAGRLVLLEGTWGKTAGIAAVQAGARALVRRIRGGEPGHHGHYTDRVISALPHGNGISPAEAVALVEASPWGPARLERLRDVEWAALDGLGLLDQLLGTQPRWAVTAGS